MKKKTSELLRWIAAGFFLISALVFIPSFASVLLLAAAVLTAPLPVLDELVRSRLRLNKTARIAIVTIIFFAGAMISPTAETSRSNAISPGRTTTSQTRPSVTQAAVSTGETEVQQEEATEDTADADVVDETPAQESATETETESAPANATPAQETAGASATPSAPVQQEPAYTEPEPNTQGYTVYITETGEKYHRAGCRHLKDSEIAIDVNTAIARGYTACKTCGG